MHNYVLLHYTTSPLQSVTVGRYISSTPFHMPHRFTKKRSGVERSGQCTCGPSLRNASTLRSSSMHWDCKEDAFPRAMHPRFTSNQGNGAPGSASYTAGVHAEHHHSVSSLHLRVNAKKMHCMRFASALVPCGME